MNLYGYVRSLPTTRFDIDGHEGWLRDLWDASTGVVQGVVSSASWGAVGAPKSTDSVMSLWGQSVGNAMVGVEGAQLTAKGTLDVGAGFIGLVPTRGRSAGLVLEGGAEIAVGTVLAGGAVKNQVAIANAMASKRLGDFTPSEKKQLDQQNANQNGGQNNCTECDRDVQKVQNKKGETPPENQLQRHHDPPLSKGGNSQSKKNRIVCRKCHQEIHKELRKKAQRGGQ